MIVNRADRADTRRVQLTCRCPGETHQGGDSAHVVKLLGYGDRGDIRQAGRAGGVEAFYQLNILRGVVSWTLTLADGTERPITPEEVRLLDEATVIELTQALDPAWAEDPVPKASGGRSRAGSRAKRSSTPATRTPPPSTTQ